jgi:hypothetical protein
MARPRECARHATLVQWTARCQMKSAPGTKAEGAEVVVSQCVGRPVVFPQPVERNARPHMPVRSSEFVEQVRRAYVLGTTPTKPLAVMFGISPSELFALVELYGWRQHAAGRDLEKTSRERANEARQAEAVREVDLYGDAIDDVRLLRQRGYVVGREGERCRVGNQLVTLADMRAKAARERRLAEAANGMPAVRHPPEHHTAR